MTHDLVQQYVEYGIIQFGRFQQTNGDFHPVAFNFLLLPSFPALMRETARAFVPSIEQSRADRLLTTRDAIPLGAVVSVESGIPLTYPHGEFKSYTSAFVIEGAYDVGHPTALLTYTLNNAADAQEIMQPARKVGLHVQDVSCVFALRTDAVQSLSNEGIGVHALLDFSEALDDLTSSRVLPASLYHHVMEWLET